MFLAFLLISIVSIPVPKVKKEFLWDTAPFPYAHVCSITELESGEFIAVYQAGSGEGKRDCQIHKSIRSVDGNWSQPELAISMDKCTMNPSIFQNDRGELLLMYHYNGGKDGTCATHEWTGYYAISRDGGKSFGEITPMKKGFLGSVKNNCIRLSNGQILCPSSTEAIEHVGIWESHFETTNQEFNAWSKSDNVHFFRGPEKFCQGIIQPTIFEFPDQPGHIRALFRSGCGVLATAKSKDYGKTWPYWAESTSVPNPGKAGAGVDMTFMNGTDIGALLVFNNSTESRTPLSLAHSVDNGETWINIMDFETDPNGRFEYPYVIQSKTNANKAYVCYSHTEKATRTLAFAELDFEG